TLRVIALDYQAITSVIDDLHISHTHLPFITSPVTRHLSQKTSGATPLMDFYRRDILGPRPRVRPRPAGPLPHRRVLTATHHSHSPLPPSRETTVKGKRLTEGQGGREIRPPLRATTPPHQPDLACTRPCLYENTQPT